MKLIQTKDYLLLIDEEDEINCSDYWVYFNDNEEFDGVITKSNLTEKEWYSKLHDRKSYKKVIAYYPLTKEAKELDLPLLPNPFEEEPLMKQASKLRELIGYHKDNHYSFCGGFIEGYKAAQSKQFSLEDMKKAIEMARELTSFGTKYLTEEIIDVISAQKLPKEFIPEYKDEYISNGKIVKSLPISSLRELKTITNSEGREELVGTYKY